MTRKLFGALLILVAAVALIQSSVLANRGDRDDDHHDRDRDRPCGGVRLNDLANALRSSPTGAPYMGAGPAGGLFGGTRMWAATVDRDGRLCHTVASTNDPSQVWPGSQSIAKSKAYTANAFSLDNAGGGFPLSTANLYTFVQPGHSLWSLGQANPFNPGFLAPTSGEGGGKNEIAGGMIFFGGGVALYKGTSIIGGLGISGDTSCADHEIAKRVRDILGLNPGSATADDIKYSSVDGAGLFTHPLCINTTRNGVFVGNELLSSGY